MQSFFYRLESAISRTQTNLCLGVDPSIHHLPEPSRTKCGLTDELDFLREVTMQCVEAAKARVPCIKFNTAYFERHGKDGIVVLKEAIQLARSHGTLTLADAKRGDISSTMDAYAVSIFDYLGADAMTFNPYMGTDCFRPLLKWIEAGKGAYMVLLTSNQSADPIQQARLRSGKKVYQQVFDSITSFASGLPSPVQCGIVIGATKIPEMPIDELEEVCNSPILLPGVGAQGAHGIGSSLSKVNLKQLLIPVSRGITSFDHSPVALPLPDSKAVLKEQFIKKIEYFKIFLKKEFHQI